MTRVTSTEGMPVAMAAVQTDCAAYLQEFGLITDIGDVLDEVSASLTSRC